MTADEFDLEVEITLRMLPEPVRDALRHIDIVVLDEPDPEWDPEGLGLLGLYVGTPLPERDHNYSGELPDVIYVFRQPHLALGLELTELKREIGKTVLHELAHYFGFDDDTLDEHGWG